MQLPSLATPGTTFPGQRVAPESWETVRAPSQGHRHPSRRGWSFLFFFSKETGEDARYVTGMASGTHFAFGEM